jgi:hypothetical protein
MSEVKTKEVWSYNCDFGQGEGKLGATFHLFASDNGEDLGFGKPFLGGGFNWNERTGFQGVSFNVVKLLAARELKPDCKIHIWSIRDASRLAIVTTLKELAALTEEYFLASSRVSTRPSESDQKNSVPAHA